MEIENHTNYNCQVTLSSGETFKVYANWLHNNNYDHWKGWSCAAGHDRIYINGNLDVHSGECCNQHLGNIKSGWELNSGMVACNKERCTGCTDDLIVKKEKQ